MHSYLLSDPIVAITMGDACGIGPEVTVKALNSRPLNKKQRFLVIGERSHLTRIAKIVKSDMPIRSIAMNELRSRKQSLKKNQINLLDLKNIKIHRPAPIQYIDLAVELIKKKLVNALVTAPVNKESIIKAGIEFTGHTEYLAAASGAKSVAMMFVDKRLKIVLVTRHLPLSHVSSNLTKKNIIDTTILADKFLKKFFRIRNPRIGILSLNPHAGEGGLLGPEEKKLIKPAINSLKTKIPSVQGPLPADSAFYDLYNQEYDVLVCMYHDQGMIPIKMLARNRAVNVTLGLPYIRTSPVHGTAFDIAGKGKADPSSMLEALNLASRLLRRC